MSQKKFKFNIIDIIAIALILVVGVFLVTKFVSHRSAGAQTVPIRYTVLCEGEPAEILDAVEQYIPSTIMASGSLYNAQVVSVAATPTMVICDGIWVEDPAHVDLTFVVEGQVERGAVLSPTLGGQEIRIGREIILKTEYLEFPTAKVIDVVYPE